MDNPSNARQFIDAASPLLTLWDIADWSLLGQRILAEDEPISTTLRSGFPASLTARIAARGWDLDPEAQQTVLDELNRRISGPSFFKDGALHGLPLRGTTRELIGKTDGPTTPLLNRLLLEDAYPFAILRLPEAEVWTGHRPDHRKIGFGFPMRRGWTAEELESWRYIADPDVERLVARLYRSGDSRGDSPTIHYNHLVDLVTKLMTDPELLFTDGSEFKACFLQYPAEFQDYFLPSQAPHWVDAEKLDRAAELWSEHGLVLLAVLCASSLPHCYLMKKGINVLYQTKHLGDPQYIYQRIFETALMVDRVMQPKGVGIVVDHRETDVDVFPYALKLALGGNWAFKDGRYQRESDSLSYSPDSSTETAVIKRRKLQTVLGELKQAIKVQRRRYLWGSGFIDARKVRFFHSAMRYVLTLMPRTGEAPPSDAAARRIQERLSKWDEKLGKPINQEDLAFTLLTFSLILPRGLEKLGCRVPVADKEAFLHLWCVIGHLMGIRGELLTDDLNQAELLFKAILEKEGGGTENGRKLTFQVMQVLRQYLPPTLGLQRFLPPGLVSLFMGDYAQEVLENEDLKLARTWQGRSLMFAVRVGLRVAFWSYRIAKRFSITAVFTQLVLRHATEYFIQTFRDEFQRRPFFVPPDPNNPQAEWRQVDGVTPEFKVQLQVWRVRVFGAIFRPMIILATVLPILAIGITVECVNHARNAIDSANLNHLFDYFAWIGRIHTVCDWLVVGSLLLLLLGVFDLTVKLPRLAKNRPEPDNDAVSLE